MGLLGKVCARIAVPAGVTKDEIRSLALADAGVQKYTDGKTIVKVIIVPGRLVNIVAK